MNVPWLQLPEGVHRYQRMFHRKIELQSPEYAIMEKTIVRVNLAYGETTTILVPLQISLAEAEINAIKIYFTFLYKKPAIVLNITDIPAKTNSSENLNINSDFRMDKLKQEVLI